MEKVEYRPNIEIKKIVFVVPDSYENVFCGPKAHPCLTEREFATWQPGPPYQKASDN